MKKIAMIPFRSKQEIAYNMIRESIVTGEFTPGQKLIISSLATNLSMSEIPIREALKILESEQLITRYGQSLRVAAISVKETMELLSVRLELESMAIRRAVKNIDSKGIKDLEERLLQMKVALQLKDTSTFGRLNKEFHSAIYEYCEVPVLIKAIQEAWNQTERARYVFRIIPGRAGDAEKEHYEIVEALRNKDAVQAERALFENLRESFDLFTEQLLKNDNK